MGYKLLGLAVWKGGKFYARRKYGHLVPSKRIAVAAGGTVAGIAVLGAVASLLHKGDAAS